MLRSILPLILATLLLLLGSSQEWFAQDADPAFRTVHLFNLSSQEDEAKLLNMVDEFNELIAELGYPEVQYRVWKVQADQTGDYTYLFDSTWPDRATYDEVHQHEKYQALFDRYRSTYEQLVGEEVYNQYVEVDWYGRVQAGYETLAAPPR